MSEFPLDDYEYTDQSRIEVANREHEHSLNVIGAAQFVQ
jgi:hypothetical protein